MAALEWTWTILFLAAWLGLSVLHLLSLRWGAIMGITAGRYAILRKKDPTKFWARWIVLAVPFVFLPAILAFGLVSLWFVS